MNRRGNAVIGAVFMIIGALFLLNNFDFIEIRMDTFWPLFVIIPGLAFHFAFLMGRNNDPGLLVPGGIILVTGLTLQISVLFNAWEFMWPGYILAVAVGLLELYLFGPRDRGLLIPVGILGGLSIIFFCINFLGTDIGKILVPVALIIIGISILAPRNRHKSF